MFFPILSQKSHKSGQNQSTKMYYHSSEAEEQEEEDKICWLTEKILKYSILMKNGDNKVCKIYIDVNIANFIHRTRHW